MKASGAIEKGIIGEMQRQINELRFEVSHLKQLEKSNKKIHYIEIRELPFTEIKNQVLEYYVES